MKIQSEDDKIVWYEFGNSWGQEECSVPGDDSEVSDGGIEGLRGQRSKHRTKEEDLNQSSVSRCLLKTQCF